MMAGKTMQPLMWPVTPSGQVEPVYLSEICQHAQAMNERERSSISENGEAWCAGCVDYVAGWRKVWVEK
jgi:hypothetical protein